MSTEPRLSPDQLAVTVELLDLIGNAGRINTELADTRVRQAIDEHLTKAFLLARDGDLKNLNGGQVMNPEASHLVRFLELAKAGKRAALDVDRTTGHFMCMASHNFSTGVKGDGAVPQAWENSNRVATCEAGVITELPR